MHGEEHTLTLEGSPAFYRSAGAPGVVYLHDAPTDSADWEPLLEHTGGVAPDLIGFGRSGKGGHLDYSPSGLERFVAALIDQLGVGSFDLVGHGWGAAVATLLAARQPERVRRLVLIGAAPPLAGEGWNRLARVWLTPVLGELVMGSINRRLLARILRGASTRKESWPAPRIRDVWEKFDQGTQRATLRLHRSGRDERTIESIRQALPSLTMPSLLVWGEQDPWCAPALATPWAERLEQAALETVPEAGHWAWLDQPAVIERIAAFLA